MSELTVGPIQTYVDDSTLSSSTTSQDPFQERVSVTLTDSNLWLVDTSKLNGQTSDSQTQLTFLDLQTKYQTTVPFDNVNFTATTVTLTGLTSSESSYLQSDLLQGDALMLASVTGGTQLGSDGISLTSTDSSSSDSGTSAGSTSGGLSGTGGGSGSSGTGAGAGAGADTGTSTGTGTSSDSSPSQQSAQTTQDTTPIDSQTTTSSQAAVSSQVDAKLQSPVDVPFEVSPTIGVVVVMLMLAQRSLKRCWKTSKTCIQLIHSEDGSINTIAHSDP